MLATKTILLPLTIHKQLTKKNIINPDIKCTVRPDWICMRVVHWIGLEMNINRYIIFIFYFSFEYLKRLQSSEPLHTKLNPTSCLLGLRFV
jgi:hypothetical protein